MKHLTLPVFSKFSFGALEGGDGEGVVLVLGVQLCEFENRTVVGYGTY